MQNANTSQMIFPVARLVAELSSGMTLLAGTVILTGTPAGVGAARNPPRFLREGDVIEIAIDGLGVLTNRVRHA
jgi:2-keto-4-pentenoate hydratase/2-oxohepta-3-ene-1,7-dioic acid hydratase in catechol pathway